MASGLIGEAKRLDATGRRRTRDVLVVTVVSGEGVLSLTTGPEKSRDTAKDQRQAELQD